ncbi:MAG: histidinol-phosphate transaminase [Pseudomonadota bacterium]|jgi:histidinol-phosphate aminotransferase
MPQQPADLIRPEILGLAAYHVPDATGMVKLDAMENPYALPDALRREIGELAARVPVNRYPDPGAAGLKAVLRDTMGIPAGAEILLGNGSDEIIQFVALALARPGAVLMAPEPSFVMYRMVATFTGMDYVGVPLAQDFSLDLPAMLAAIERRRPAVIFLAYPNNPTGNLFDAAAVEAVLRAAPGLVVVDEAYHAFAGASFLPRLDRYPNLLVMRTLSKLGLAGLRLGFAAAAAEWITHLEKLRLPYNVNSLTQAIAARVLGDAAVLEGQAEAIVAERARLLAALQNLPFVTAFPSAANFILFRIPEAQRVCERLKERRILIKNLHGSHPRLDNCLRVTVGTPEENRAFLDALHCSLN